MISTLLKLQSVRHRWRKAAQDNDMHQQRLTSVTEY